MLTFAITLVVLFLGAGLLLRLMEGRLIYHPVPLEGGELAELAADLPESGARFEEVSFPTEDGETVTGWLGVPERPRGWLLWLHGNAGNVLHRWEDFSRFVVREEVAVLILDYRGYGRSTGRPDEGGLALDARAALDFLGARGVESERVFLLGRSLGGAVAVRLAEERPVAGVVMESTFLSIRAMARHTFPFFPAGWFAKSRFATDERIGRLTVPVLHFHGRADGIVPFSHGRRLSELAPEEGYEFVPVDSGHNDLSLSMGDAYFERVVRFIAD